MLKVRIDIHTKKNTLITSQKQFTILFFLMIISGSLQSDGEHRFPPEFQCDGGDSPGSGETPVLRKETPSPDLTLNSDGSELES